MGTYYNSDKESVPLMVKIGDGTSAFKFYSYTNVLAGIAATLCTGSKDYTFV